MLISSGEMFSLLKYCDITYSCWPNYEKLTMKRLTQTNFRTFSIGDSLTKYKLALLSVLLC